MEGRLRAQARKKKLKGRRADAYVYGTMNNTGVMHGNKTTDKGMHSYAAHRRMTGY
jgi:hypothetical protein